MNKEENLILIWYGEKQKWISKERIIGELVEENARMYKAAWDDYYKIFCVESLGSYFIILENLDKISTLQIYQDNVIRLHLKHEHYEQPKCIIVSATEDEIIKLKQIFKIAT